VEVKIFNRWGQVVFESNDMAKGWDGTFHGKPQSIDTYAYTIKAIDMEGKDIFVKGYITLLR
jgi:gliding motility-associated-like protein